MKPAIDDMFLPCGWSRATTHEDGIAFVRDGGCLTLVVERTDESTTTRICTGPVWRIRCEQRAGEAESGISLDCVTTFDTAVGTSLTYMRRINEISEFDEGISVGTVVELLRDESIPDGYDDWGRTPSDHLDTQPPSP